MDANSKIPRPASLPADLKIAQGVPSLAIADSEDAQTRVWKPSDGQPSSEQSGVQSTVSGNDFASMTQEMTIIAKPDLRDPNLRRSDPPGGGKSRPAARPESGTGAATATPAISAPAAASPSSPAAAEPRPSPVPLPESHTRTTRSRTPTHPSSRGARRGETAYGDETTVRRPGRRSTLFGFSLGLLVGAAALFAAVTRRPPELFKALDRWTGRAAAEAAPAVDPASDTVRISMEITPKNAHVSMDGIPISQTIDLPKSNKERMLLIEAEGYRSTNMLITSERSRNVHIQLTRNEP